MAGQDSGVQRCVAADHRSSADVDTLAEFKNALRQHLRARVALDTKRCIACTHAYTWSFAGRLNRFVWDLLVCVGKITIRGKKAMGHWTFVIVSKTDKGVSLCPSGWPWQTVLRSTNWLSMRSSMLTISRLLFLAQMHLQTSGDQNVVQILRKLKVDCVCRFGLRETEI